MSGEDKGIKFGISEKHKALQFSVTKFNGGGCLISDRFTGMQYSADEGALVEAVNNMGDDVRRYLEELLKANGHNKPVIVAIQFIDKVPTFPQIGAFNSAPTMSPLAALIFQVGNTMGINTSFPLNKEGFIKFSEEVANKLDDEKNIIDPHAFSRPNAFDANLMGGWPFSPVDDEEDRKATKYGNANKTRVRQGTDGKTILD